MNVGDKVTWTSQSQGSAKKKDGVVVEIVPAKQYAKIRQGNDGMPRDHESYIVRVDPVKGSAKPKYYWPRVSALSVIA